jgi:hypothetical protein
VLSIMHIVDILNVGMMSDIIISVVATNIWVLSTNAFAKTFYDLTKTLLA